MRFHINPETGEVGACRALARSCPFSGVSMDENHYDTKYEAEDAAQKMLLNRHSSFVINKKTKYVAPIMPKIEPITFKESEELLERTGRKNVCEGNIVGYSLLGSSLYGLNTADSDRDVLIITDTKARKDFHHVYDDGADVRVTSIYSFSNRVLESQPTDVDLLMSNTVVFHNKNYLPYMNSLRFNKFVYLDRVEAHAIQDLENGLNDDKNEKRARKSLKTAFRNFVMFERVLKDGSYYTSRFTKTERDNFYINLEKFYEMRENGYNSEYIIDEMRQSAKKV